MNFSRADLLELTPEALIALANAGFVKRAQKDVAEGNLPEIEELEDGTIRAKYPDGQRTTLAPSSTLREASCTCSASGLCRHRVTLVLAYQAHAKSLLTNSEAVLFSSKEAVAQGPWSPSQFTSTISEAIPAGTLNQAMKLAAEQPVARVIAWQESAPVPSVHLPMCNVRFFSRSSLAHARCDCKEGRRCAHIVLAIWAFLQAESKSPDFTEASITVLCPQADSGAPVLSIVDTAAATLLLDRLHSLVQQIWFDGSSQPVLAIEGRFEEVLALSEQLGWCWINESIRSIKDLINAQHTRSSRFDPQVLLSTLAQLHGRISAAVHAENQSQSGQLPQVPASQLLGIGVKGKVSLDHLRLVSLGAQLWTEENREGASLVFADPDTLSITVIERSWPKSKAGEAQMALIARRIAGQSIKRLAASQIVTNGARRRANGLLELTAAARQSNILPLSPDAWSHLGAPLRQSSASALRDYLLNAMPDFVRPLQVIEHMHILSVARICHWEWNAAQQALYAQIQMGEQDLSETSSDEIKDDQVIELLKQHNLAAPGAIDALVGALSGEFGQPIAISGTVRLVAGVVVINPFAILTTQRIIVLDVETAAPHDMGRGVRTKVSPPLLELINQVPILLAHWLRQGLHHQGAGALLHAETVAASLQHAGLCEAATLLRTALKQLQHAEKNCVPAQLSTLCLLLAEVATSLRATRFKQELVFNS